MRFLSFDAGIGSPGLTVIEKTAGGLVLLHHQVVRTKSSEPLSVRLRAIWDAVSKAINAWHPGWIAIEEQRTVQAGKFKEKQFNSDNSKTILTVGIVMGAAMAYGVPFAEVRTQTAKKVVTGDPHASKQEVQAAIERELGVKLPQDSADSAAIGIAFAGLTPEERLALANKAPKPKKPRAKKAKAA